MTALKDHLDPQLVDALASELHAAWPDLPVETFTRRATEGLLDLELKGRVEHLAAAMRATLPRDASNIVEVLDAALSSPTFTGWMVWPCAALLGSLGPDDPEVVLPAMARLTHRSSCEFAIRPYLDHHPELTFAFLQRWVRHPDAHVRRLVSEGTRPRLPWGTRLRELQRDPTPSLALLDQLREDPSAYVRRSVANHLGDIVKDHPDLAIATAERWRTEGGRHVDEVVRHGLRTLIKAGHPAALALVGYAADAPVRLVRVGATPSRLPIGERTLLEVELTADGDAPVPVVVEYLVHYLGVRGPRKPKAYRLAERVLEPGEPCRLARRQRFDHATIRTLYPGDHRIEIQVNGRVLGACTVELSDEPNRRVSTPAARATT